MTSAIRFLAAALMLGLLAGCEPAVVQAPGPVAAGPESGVDVYVPPARHSSGYQGTRGGSR